MEVIAKDLLPLRVFRSEPRVLKRRPKPFARMNKPRAVLKAALRLIQLISVALD